MSMNSPEALPAGLEHWIANLPDWVGILAILAISALAAAVVRSAQRSLALEARRERVDETEAQETKGSETDD